MQDFLFPDGTSLTFHPTGESRKKIFPPKKRFSEHLLKSKDLEKFSSYFYLFFHPDSKERQSPMQI